MSKIHETISENVRFIRFKDDNISQEKFANKLRVSKTSIFEIETGEFNCSFSLLDSIARHYNFFIGDLFRDDFISRYHSNKTGTYLESSMIVFRDNVTSKLKDDLKFKSSLYSTNAQSTTISNIFTGNGNPKINAYIAIANQLNAPLASLFERS